MSAQPTLFDAVLVDDDPLVRMAWGMAAKRNQKIIQLYATPVEFLRVLESISQHSPIYIDSKFEDGTTAEELIQRLHHLGYQELYISTGYPPEHFQHLTETLKIIRGIVGKDPPWILLS